MGDVKLNREQAEEVKRVINESLVAYMSKDLIGKIDSLVEEKPFDGEISPGCEIPPGQMLVYTGKTGHVDNPSDNKWFVTREGKAWNGWSSITHSERPLLALVPIKKKEQEHWDGEPCTLPVGDRHIERARWLRFEYTALGDACGKWFVADTGDCILFDDTGSFSRKERWVLRAIKEKHKWSVGDLAYCTRCNEIVKIDRVSQTHDSYNAFDIFGSSEIAGHVDELRPLTDSDWTCNIKGIKVRAYRDDDDGDIWLVSEGNGGSGIINTNIIIAKEMCRLSRIPVMPYSLSHGEYKRPE